MIRRMAAVVVGVALAGGAALAQDRSSPVDVLLKEGKKLRDAKDYDAARAFFEAAAKVDPKSAPALVQLSWVYNEQQDYEKATRTAQDAIKLDPSNADAQCELGYAHLKQKQYLKAITSLRKAVATDDRNWTAYGYLVEALRAVGEDEEADTLEATKKKKMNTTTPKFKD